MGHFGDKILEISKKKNTALVVGLDPNVNCFPDFLLKGNNIDELSISDLCDAIYRFNCLVIDAVEEHVLAIKPQLAYYEIYGSKGLEVLEKTIDYAKSKEIMIINDAKRGDIESTADAYASAFLRNSPIAGDAVTVNPFLGSDGIKPFIRAAEEEGKGIFLLLKTSNPSSAEIQDLTLANQQTLYSKLAQDFSLLAKNTKGKQGYSFIGAVVGATYPAQAMELRKILNEIVFLVPGFGKQGADPESLRAFFNDDGFGAMVSSSRGILYSYTEELQKWKELSPEQLKSIIKKNAIESKNTLNMVRFKK